MDGSPEDEAVQLADDLRREKIARQQLVVAAAAGIPAANLVLNMGQAQAIEECNAVLPAPPRDIFAPIYEQVAQIWKLNRRYWWRFSASDFVGLPIPTHWPNDRPHNLVALVLVPYLEPRMSTFAHLTEEIEGKNLHAAHDWDRRHGRKRRLLEGIVYPGRCLRWETIDLGAGYPAAGNARVRDVRNASSAHAGALAACILHKRWVAAMDRRTVPYVAIGGYQFGGEPDWPYTVSLTPFDGGMSFHNHDVSLDVYGYAVPAFYR